MFFSIYLSMWVMNLVSDMCSEPCGPAASENRTMFDDVVSEQQAVALVLFVIKT